MVHKNLGDIFEIASIIKIYDQSTYINSEKCCTNNFGPSENHILHVVHSVMKFMAKKVLNVVWFAGENVHSVDELGEPFKIISKC